jgi:hypothetical protein
LDSNPEWNTLPEMETANLHGRFLPSRVFSRWKWTVRFGLLILPLVLFLAGALQLYFSPSRYLSRTVFEITNGPSLRETEELLRAENVLARVSEKLDLPRRLDLDRDNCVAGIRSSLETRILKDTRMIRLEVTRTRNIDARDLAEEIPRSLVGYLAESMTANSERKVAELERLATAQADRAKELSNKWIKLEEVHGKQPADPGAATAIDRARRAALAAEVEVERLGSLQQAERTRLIDHLPRLVVHTAPVIGSKPEGPKSGEEMGRLVVICLIWALAAALLLPYLFELAFPPATGRQKPPAPVIDL